MGSIRTKLKKTQLLNANLQNIPIKNLIHIILIYD